VIEALDNGMRCGGADARAQPISAFEYFAGLADKIFGHTSQMSSRGHDYFGYTLKEPIGVAGLIVPLERTTEADRVQGCAGARGRTPIVLKPAEEASLSALRCPRSSTAAGVPPAIQCRYRRGVPAGSHLTEHPDVDKVFVHRIDRSRQADRLWRGWQLEKADASSSGASLRLVILDDADLATAILPLRCRSSATPAEVCKRRVRLIVHVRIYNRVVEGIDAAGRKLRLGYYSDADADLGP